MRGIRARRLGNSIRARLKRPVIFTLVTVLLLFVLIIAYVISNIGSMVVELALADATDVITITVNDVISEKVMDGSIDYSDLVTLEKDADGNITALLTNMANVNYLQSEITGEIVKRFSDMDVTRVDIPIGNLIGGTLLSGRGPKISVDILSVTNVSATLRNEFSSAGINQTRHRIILQVDVGLGILLSGYRDKWDDVQTEITVCETVIVERVPETYASLG
ncbi:MAG: sporulation protein YunB [Oscillospiraceae bacterium]|nr:sporulation protein YunB [Oscillospiraceae bacterium]